ncbi:MAG: sulfotransferase [Myxococcales bacterium]|nr:MAG: sulfotransferase [Myxococcales bacterium]
MSVTTATTDQRLPVRLFNSVLGVRDRLGFSGNRFTASIDEMHETVAREAGCEDFGDDLYKEGLGVLCEAYDREARLTPWGRIMVDRQLRGILRNRLSAQCTWNEHREILDRRVERPIFVLGLPRTGTTALHHLLGCDPSNQVLEYWLAESPSPRPPRESWKSHAHYRKSTRNLKTMYWLDPDLKAIHLMTADGPEECRHLLQQSFTDDTFDCNSTIPSYSGWYASVDMRPSYERHSDLLKLIGHGDSRRWLLKYPVHMGSLETLLEIYPDACFVQTHRDPARVLPSICSLVAAWRAIYEDSIDRPVIARWQMELWASRLEHALVVREQCDHQAPGRFYDLSFRDIVTDPVAAIRGMYRHFELELSAEAEQRITDFAGRNPRGKHGEHRYRAADFDLTADTMHDRFATYLDHFAIEREALP